jgi:hypothetical protein
VRSWLFGDNLWIFFGNDGRASGTMTKWIQLLQRD